MYCKRCGEKIEENWKYCPSCKSILNANTIEIDKEKILESKKNESKAVTIYLIVFFIGMFGLLFFERIRGICFLVSLISIVTASVKYENNKLVKVIFWIFLTLVIIATIYIIILVFTCANAIANCNYSCPG